MDPCLVWIRLRLPEEELGSLVRDFTGQAKFEQWNNPQVAPPWLDQVTLPIEGLTEIVKECQRDGQLTLNFELKNSLRLDALKTAQSSFH